MRRVLLWALFGLTLVALVVMVAVTLIDELDPSSGGTPGTAVITHCGGQGTNLQCYGDYRATDGTTVLRDTRIFGEDDARPGQTFRVYAQGGSVDTVNSGEDLSTNLVIVGWLVLLAFAQCYFRIMVPRRRRRSLVARSELDALLDKEKAD